MSLHAEQGHVPPRTGPSVFPSRGVSGLQRTDKGTVAAEGGVGPASTGGTAHVPSPLGPLGAAGTGWRRAGAGLTLQHHGPPPAPAPVPGEVQSLWPLPVCVAGSPVAGREGAGRGRCGYHPQAQVWLPVVPAAPGPRDFSQKTSCSELPPPSSSDPPKALKQLRTPPGPGLGEVTDAPN